MFGPWVDPPMTMMTPIEGWLPPWPPPSPHSPPGLWPMGGYHLGGAGGFLSERWVVSCWVIGGVRIRRLNSQLSGSNVPIVRPFELLIRPCAASGAVKSVPALVPLFSSSPEIHGLCDLRTSLKKRTKFWSFSYAQRPRLETLTTSARSVRFRFERTTWKTSLRWHQFAAPEFGVDFGVDPGLLP